MLEIKMMNTCDINPADYNPRDISSAAFEGLKESLRKFGFVDPAIVNVRTGTLVGGHQRVKAAEAIGMTEVPVVEVDLSPAEEKALNITLNNTRISGYFTDTLQYLLDELRKDVPEIMEPLLLNDLVIDDNWDSGSDVVDKIEENLDGIDCRIIIKCPQEIKDEVLIFIKGKLLETSFEGVEVV